MENRQVFELRCEVTQVRFQKDFFAICECKTKEPIPEEASTGFPLSGKWHFIALGDGLCTEKKREIVLSGKWEKNEKFGGLQLRISDCKDYVGSGRDEIIAYLSSKILKGVGVKTAELIYERFGEESLTIIEENPRALLTIPGIKERKLNKMLAAFEKNREHYALVRLLAPFGVPYKTVVRIHQSLGASSAAQVRQNPYLLCDVEHFGFKKADAIALRMGNFGDSDFRITGAINYVLSEAQSGQGHLFLRKGELANRCCSDKVLNNGQTSKIDPEAIHPVITAMLERGELCSVVWNRAGDTATEEAIYPKSTYVHERVAALNLVRLLVQQPKHEVNWSKAIINAQEKLQVTLDTKQAEGAIMALTSCLSIITGGPGTGKTTGLRVIIEAFRTVYPDANVVLAAPTGRAARRMTEQTGIEASTLHSLLGLRPDSYTDFNATLEEEELINADLLVIDESSMIDAKLMAELMFRIANGAQVLFLGDVDQLPSVGAGNVLRQMLNYPGIPNTRLTKIFRQSEESVIPVNAANIRAGKNELHQNKYFKIMHCKSEAEGAAAIVELQRRCMERGFETIDTQILCPMKRHGEACTYNINKALHDIMNPPAPGKEEITVGEELFRVGDKVMQTRNIQGASNGDIGFITKIGPDEEAPSEISVEVLFCGSEVPVKYDKEALYDLEHANAITIHKSQGTEFYAVIVPMFKSMSFFLKRNLLYTAITRARVQVVIVTDEDETGVATAIRKADTARRNTYLAEFIAWEHAALRQVSQQQTTTPPN